MNCNVKASSQEETGLEAHLKFKSKKVIVQGMSSNPIQVSMSIQIIYCMENSTSHLDSFAI